MKARTLFLAISLLLPIWARGFYNPQSGRWLSRDPIAEAGGVPLYAFVRNSPLDTTDKLGRDYLQLSDLQTMLHWNVERLRARLLSLCPNSSAMQWAGSDGAKQCCSPSGCRAQVEALVSEFKFYLTVTFTAQSRRFGDIIAFYQWPLAQDTTINDRAEMAPGNGQSWMDYNQGYGLKCQGWQALIRERTKAVLTPWLTAHKLCFKGASVGNGSEQKTSAHNWYALYGPYNDDVHVIDADIDPWFSAGGFVMPTFPATARYWVADFW